MWQERKNGEKDTPPSWAPVQPPEKGGKSNYSLQSEFRALKQNKTVSNALGDKGFSSKLESILQGQVQGKAKPKLARPLAEDSQYHYSKAFHQQGIHTSVEASRVVLPINDLHAAKYAPAEKQLRCKLAAVYRMVDLFGWSQLIYNHITAKVPGKDDHILVNGFGLMYHEVTASNLIRVDLQGAIYDSGTSGLGLDGPGLALHCVIHRARKDISCVLHLHHTTAVAVSTLKCGLLHMSSQAAKAGTISYCDRNVLERESDTSAILGRSQVLVLHGCGMLVMGESIEEAFSITHNLMKACEIQIAALSAGHTDHGVGCENEWAGGGLHRMRSHSELEFKALMRMLDKMGYETGYMYEDSGHHGSSMQGENTQQKVSTYRQSTEGPCRKEGNKTHALHTVAEQVARSTENALLKATVQIEKDSTASETTMLTAAKVARSTGAALQKVAESSYEGNILEQPQITAQRVARSTGAALQKVTESSYEGDILEQAQMTAQRVARSTGAALQKVTESSYEGNILEQPQITAESIAKSSGGALQQLPSSTSSDKNLREHEEDFPRGENLLQDVQVTAKRVALSTGKASQRLHTSNGPDPPNGQVSDVSHRKVSNLDTTEKCTSSSGGDGVHNGYLNFSSVNKNKSKRPYISRKEKNSSHSSISSTEYSTTDSEEMFAFRNRGRSVSLMAHTKAIINDPDLEASPLERMMHTAELVAKSTGKAMRTLTTSLQP